jgi:DNA-binding MarR family transcriptional regulator
LQKDEKMILAHELIRCFAQFKKVNWHEGSFNGVKKSEIFLLGTMVELMEDGSAGVKTSDLSSKLHVTPSAVTHMINSLEEGGFVERKAEPKDRRIVLVRPTEKGEHIMGLAKDMVNKNFEDLVDFLGVDDSKELTRLLAVIYEYFTKKNNFNCNK